MTDTQQAGQYDRNEGKSASNGKMQANPRANQIDRDAGARLRAVRASRGITQQKLAAEIGITFQQVQKYEKGTNRISLSTLIMICKALKCHPMEIIGWDYDTPAKGSTSNRAHRSEELRS